MITSKRLGVTGADGREGRTQSALLPMAIYAAACKPTATEYSTKRADENHDREATHDRKRYFGCSGAGDDGRKLAATDHFFVCPRTAAALKPIGILHLHDILKAGI